jgi:hypothetical protein
LILTCKFPMKNRNSIKPRMEIQSAKQISQI